MNHKIQNMFRSPGHIGQDELDAYLRGNASPELVRKVELAMLDDEPLFSDAVEGYQEMGVTALPSLENFADFKKKLPEQQGVKVVQLNPARRMMQVAAVAAVLVAAVAGYLAFQPASEQALFTEFYQPYQNDISLTIRGGSGTELQADFRAALSIYGQGKFSEALPSFEKALQAEPDNEAAHFFAGMAYLESGDASVAIDHFNIAGLGTGIYARKAQWYAVLTALKLGEKDLATALLDRFLETKGYKDAEARKLREKL